MELEYSSLSVNKVISVDLMLHWTSVCPYDQIQTCALN